MSGFECCYCGKQITTEAALIEACEQAPGGWHVDEPYQFDAWAEARGRWAEWD